MQSDWLIIMLIGRDIVSPISLNSLEDMLSYPALFLVHDCISTFQYFWLRVLQIKCGGTGSPKISYKRRFI